jgi:hypothetical protein
VVNSANNDSDTLKRTANAEAQTEKLTKGTGKGTSKGKGIDKTKVPNEAPVTKKGAKTAEEVKKPAVKKEKKERAESNEHIGERLLKEKANEATILAAFTKVYKDKKGITDKKFVQARANIYMTIAKKRAEAKAETVKKEVKKAKAA